MNSFNKEDYLKYSKEFFDQINTPESKREYEDLINNPRTQARYLQQMESRCRPKTEKYWILRKILVEAVKTGNERAVSNAISHGADMTIWLMAPQEYDFPCGILGLAAMHGHHNLIYYLLKAGIEVDDPGGTNRSPLHIAAERNYVEFARKLIQAGADLEKTTYETAALTSLHLAVSHGHSETIHLLLKENANIEAKAQYDYTPLHKAAQ
ncbi:unnamed protein product, partial [Meganyctiphanes norvegica]